MSITRYWSPLEEIKQLENDVSNIFRNYGMNDEGIRRLRLDIEENPDEYVIHADLPGINTEDLDLEATSQYLEIKVSAKKETDKNDKNYILRERFRSNYIRRITFDKPVNTQKATTELKDGVLTITLPKLEEAKSVKLIPESN